MENEQEELITSRKAIDEYLSPKNIIEDFKQKLGFWKTCVCHSELNKTILQNFLMRSVVILIHDFFDTIK